MFRIIILGTIFDLTLKMMRLIYSYCILLILIGIPFGLSAQDEGADYIQWSSRKLKWEDFKGVPTENSTFVALTASSIQMEYSGSGSMLKFKISTVFDPSNSWKKKNVNNYVLGHEQIHFDITEYYARKLKKELKNHKFKNIESIERDVKELFEEASAGASRMQAKYDEQTEHSLNKEKQKKWSKKIKKLLRSVRNHQETEIEINISYLLN